MTTRLHARGTGPPRPTLGPALSALVLTVLWLVGGCVSPPDLEQEPTAEPQGYEVAGNGTLLLDLNSAPSLAEVGGALLVDDRRSDRPVIIARTGNSSFVAASARDTSSDGRLRYDRRSRTFRDEGEPERSYGLDGDVVHGPAGEPLSIYPTRIEGTVLIVELGDNAARAQKRTVVVNAPYYRGGYPDGPEQAMPPDGRLAAGTVVVLLEDAGAYSLVQTTEGTTVYVATDCLALEDSRAVPSSSP